MGIPSPTGIQGDPALTSYGIDQAKELGKHLDTLNPAVEKVYSSPFYRCLQTMVPFMERQLEKQQQQQQQQEQQQLQKDKAKKELEADDDQEEEHKTKKSAQQTQALQISPDDYDTPKPWLTGTVVTKMLPEHGIREWFGSAPFDHPEPAAPGILKAMFSSYDEKYVSTVRPSTKGETLDQLQERITKALRGIIQQCDADGTRAIVLCSHAAVIILIGRILTGVIPDSVDVDDFHAYTCGLSVYNRIPRGAAKGNNNISDSRDDRHSHSPPYSTPDTSKVNMIGGWDCELNSDCSFLSGGAERGWRFTGDESFPDTGSLSQNEVGSKL
ncbi:RNA polymerase III transcription initiation factor complex component [Pochonia chlamydosporia 170]|uniref:RNA polymerase III transcription initiation factor complex component n=1 Tax=Pochonia chlamydosporia 170 TaxID=1380566 RepID=A0A179FXN5_METCM|nr:RNA polymerase III transcription initiation factor complex component [Pochonia chlamydosporia 170]OAQ70392.1 RNA polymerase III transcription initiation factor complex component [Pochonia chlamydosporia 170]